MSDPRPLSDYLPYRFSNGESIQRFAKECPECSRLIHADKMQGMMAEGTDKVLMLAQVSCPFCEAEFGVCCTIDATKRVQRLSVWIAFFFLLIRRYRELEPLNEENVQLSDAAKTSLQAETQTFTAPQQVAHEVLGHFLDHAIPAWVEVQAKRYHFVRTQPSGLPFSLQQDEIILKPGLIYKHSL